MTAPGKFEYCAFDKNRCDLYYHNGQQVRYFRQQPPHLACVPWARDKPASWLQLIFNWLKW